jgi:hypothetical protein
LLERESLLWDILTEGVKSFGELTRALFPNPLLHFFPGCTVRESHLIKLESDGVIKRKEYQIVLV